MDSEGSSEPLGAQLSRATPKLTPFFPISYLHPNGGKKSKYKTSVQKTLNPEFNEVGQGWGEAVLAAGGGRRGVNILLPRAQAPATLSHSPV